MCKNIHLVKFSYISCYIHIQLCTHIHIHLYITYTQDVSALLSRSFIFANRAIK